MTKRGSSCQGAGESPYFRSRRSSEACHRSLAVATSRWSGPQARAAKASAIRFDLSQNIIVVLQLRLLLVATIAGIRSNSMVIQMRSENVYETTTTQPLEPTRRQILLIDDDQDMAEMLAEYLGPEGYVVHLAHTAKAGLERAREDSIALIILDVMLPDENGFTVLQEIRRTSRIPVIMLTTRAAVADKVAGLEGGADDYIPKPFTPMQILARIRTVLQGGLATPVPKLLS